MYKKFLLSFLIAAAALCPAKAQETQQEKHSWHEFVSGEVSYASSYIYRGMNVASHSAFALLSCKYKGFELDFEYGAALNGKYMETVVNLSYTYKDFTFYLRDQFFPVYEGVKALSYFNWNPTETSHQLEALLQYKPQNIPIKILWSTFVAGYDLRYSFDEQGNFTWGDRAFSSYLEFTAYHRFPKMHTIAGTMGFSVNKGLYTGYQANFALVNTRISYSKTWDCKYFYPTVGAYCVFNPYAAKFYPVAYVSFAF